MALLFAGRNRGDAALSEQPSSRRDDTRRRGYRCKRVRIAAAIRTGRVSSREIVEACLARIDSVNARLNAVVQRSPTAVEEAIEADRALARGTELGALHLRSIGQSRRAIFKSLLI